MLLSNLLRGGIVLTQAIVILSLMVKKKTIFNKRLLINIPILFISLVALQNEAIGK